MTVQSASSAREKFSATGIFILVAALGWLPFVTAAGRAPYVERGFLLISLAVGMLALMLVYDTAERFIGHGRGLYLAAVFCSLPATGLLLSDPGLLPAAMLLLLVSAATWFALRAEGDQRAFLLAMLGGLLLIAGYAYQFFPGSLALVFPVWLAALRSPRRLLTALVLPAVYGAGLLLRQLGGLSLPLFQLPHGPADLPVTMALMPWRLHAVLVFIILLFMPRATKPWHVAALATLVLTSAVSMAAGTSLAVVGGVLAPVLTLLAGDVALQSFATDASVYRRRLMAFPPAAAAIMILSYMLLGYSGRSAILEPGSVQLAAGLAIVLLLIFAVVRSLPRWSFALLFVSGLWFGSYLWPQPGLQPGESSEPLPLQALSFAGALAGAAALAVYRWYYGREIPREALPNNTFRFAGADFRRFDGTRIWSGEHVTLEDPAPDSHSFMIFGDVTGAESPVTARRSGFYAFRRLTETMHVSRPRFAIALGDLAARSSAHAFRRARRLLQSVPVPLTAIPGNHDVFRDGRYDSRYFQSLFGADHHAFIHGPVHFVLINNASGAFEQQQFLWLEATLRGSNAPFLLVFCHKPVFDLRPGGTYAMEVREQALRLHELFRAFQVTAVFSGHIHSLLSGTRDGVTYVVSGGGGSRLAAPGDVHHYLLVSVGAGTLVVRALPLGTEDEDEQAALLELQFTPRLCSSAAAARS